MNQLLLFPIKEITKGDKIFITEVVRVGLPKKYLHTIQTIKEARTQVVVIDDGYWTIEEFFYVVDGE